MILDDLDNEIREIEAKLHEVQSFRDNITKDKLTVYMERDENDPWLNPFPWAFENDIIMTVEEKMIRIPLDNTVPRKASYVVYRFKKEEDAVAFKLKWM